MYPTHYPARKVSSCLTLLFLTLISYSQDYEALAEDCPCIVAWKQKSDQFLANVSSEDIQIYSQCITLEMYECAYTCEEDPAKKMDIQNAINQCQNNIQYYIDQGIPIDCDNLSGSYTPSAFGPPTFTTDSPSSNQSSTSSAPTSSGSNKNLFDLSNPPEQRPLYDPWWFQQKAVGSSEADQELVESVGQLVNAIFVLNEQGRQEKIRRLRAQAERERQQQIQEEQAAAERARLAAMQEARNSFIASLEHSQFPYSAPYSSNYFFFISMESEQELSLSNVFEVPKKANQQLPYRSDIVTDFKDKTDKEEVWIQGIFGNPSEAQMAQNLFKEEATKSFFSFQAEVPYHFHVGYTVSNSNTTPETESSESFWGNTKGNETEVLAPDTSNNILTTAESDSSSHPFYSEIKKIEFPEKANPQGNYCFFLVPQTNGSVLFSNVFELPKTAENQLPKESGLLASINQQMQYSTLYLQGVFENLTQAQLAKQQLIVDATQNGLQLGKEIHFTYQSVDDANSDKAEGSFWGVKKQN